MKGGRKTTVKRKSFILLIIPLGHIRRCFLHGCTSNSFLLTLSTSIFSVYSDQLFLSLSTNSLFGLFGPEPTPVLGSSQNWSLQLAPSVGKARSDQKEILVQYQKLKNQVRINRRLGHIRIMMVHIRRNQEDHNIITQWKTLSKGEIVREVGKSCTLIGVSRVGKVMCPMQRMRETCNVRLMN